MLLQRSTFPLLFALSALFLSLRANSQADSMQFRHEIGIPVVGPLQVVSNLMEGKPVWHGARFNTWYSYHFNQRKAWRTEISFCRTFDLNQKDELMGSYELMDSVPDYDESSESQAGAMKGNERNVMLYSGLEWTPFRNLGFLRLVSGPTFSSGNADYYNAIDRVYLQKPPSSIPVVVGDEHFYRITRLRYNKAGLFTQLRVRFSITRRMTLSIDGYFSTVSAWFNRESNSNYSPGLVTKDYYQKFETAVRISGGLGFYF